MKTTSALFDECVANIPPYIKMQTDMSFSIADKICAALDAKGMTKKQLAEGLDVRPSVVSEWVSGQHNFTLRTIARISTYLNTSLL